MRCGCLVCSRGRKWCIHGTPLVQHLRRAHSPCDYRGEGQRGRGLRQSGGACLAKDGRMGRLHMHGRGQPGWGGSILRLLVLPNWQCEAYRRQSRC